MLLCSCGFANPDEAATCGMCGKTLVTSGDTPNIHSCARFALSLRDLRTGAVATLPLAGGIVGRAGDANPDMFSPQVSGVHLVAEPCSEGAAWKLEWVGRNPSYVQKSGAWVPLRAGHPCTVRGGELVRLADMLLRVEITPDESLDAAAMAENGASGAHARATGENEVRCAHIEAGAENPEAIAQAEAGAQPSEPPAQAEAGAQRSEPPACEEPPAQAWVVTCPVCGLAHPVASAQSRVPRCERCADPLDRRAIARVAATPAVPRAAAEDGRTDS